ncbi:MAG: tripartite tricarboxylate transporter TctB family protein [Mycobacteriaceae bacterium]
MSEDPASSGTAGRRPGVPDMLAGGTFVALGLAFAIGGGTYGMGSTRAMGPGFVPVVLGVILTVLGAFITTAAFRGGDSHDREAADERGPVPWARGGMLVAGIVFFGATIEGLGLAPALFVTTFVAALACRGVGPRGVGPLKALAISVGLTVLCLGIFVGLLQLRLPLLGDWLGG